jgi:hypothetical protein
VGDCITAIHVNYPEAMHRKYRLDKPVVAFSQEICRVVTIPAGSLVNLVSIGLGLGIQTASWDGRPIMVFREDLENNSRQAGRVG